MASFTLNLANTNVNKTKKLIAVKKAGTFVKQ